jgi:sodium/potassium-transporting ATPase subunit beta
VYEFEEEGHGQKKGGIGRFMWNSRTKEFLGRDGLAWGKLGLFYAIFYTCLGSFFIGLLAIFYSVMPQDLPTYYGLSSTMNVRGLNPGLGFRPQLDVESHEIRYNPQTYDGKGGIRKYIDNLNIYLDHVYNETVNPNLVIDCVDGRDYIDQLKSGKACRFDYKSIFANTPCTSANDYGFKTDEACVLIKMNRIVSWLPELHPNQTYINIKCEGEYKNDKEHFLGATYYSETLGESKTEGKIDTKYFPYFNQNAYRAPFIFVRAKVTPNTLVNVECRAFARNIDYERLNKRGVTKFSLYVSNHSPSA